MMKDIFISTAIFVLVLGLYFAKTDAQEVGTVIIFNLWLLAGMTYKADK